MFVQKRTELKLDNRAKEYTIGYLINNKNMDNLLYNLKRRYFMKIVNTKKFIRSILLILGIIFIISLIISKASFSYKVTEYKTIYVSSGDTLWSIASMQLKTNDYYKNEDIRFVINDLIKINNLENSNIQANQELKVPII
ncbi:MAG: LysM peptidoglycan-binding domain-containing protein [Clostridiales bacterium]|nr:LysM peptidoglycan-binding domain-containing protein [Clostridiales bacterium]